MWGIFYGGCPDWMKVPGTCLFWGNGEGHPHLTPPFKGEIKTPHLPPLRDGRIHVTPTQPPPEENLGEGNKQIASPSKGWLANA